MESTRAEDKNLDNAKGKGPMDATAQNPDCKYFADKITIIEDPAEIFGNADPASKIEDFNRMDWNKDNKVTIDECRKSLENDLMFEQMMGYGEQTDVGENRVNMEQFCEYHQMQGEYVSKAACEVIFTIKDVDQAGTLTEEQAVSTPAEDMQREKDRNPGCTPVRRLHEAIVNEPRRQRRALKMMKRELRSRMRARRNLQAHHSNHENHYEKWVNRRMEAAEHQVARKQRRLNKERRRLQKSKRRVLSIASADNKNTMARKLFGSDKFFSRIEAEIVDMPIREDYQAMDDSSLKVEHRKLTRKLKMSTKAGRRLDHDMMPCLQRKLKARDAYKRGLGHDDPAMNANMTYSCMHSLLDHHDLDHVYMHL
jgi:hypothetical protein